MPASSRRCRRRCRSLTQSLSGALDFEREIERVLMLQRALLVRQAQVVLDKTEIDPGACGFDGCGFGHAARIQQPRITAAADRSGSDSRMYLRTPRSSPAPPASARE